MAKISLNPDPTFTAKVPVPVAGAGNVSVEFTFKHRTRSQVKQWLSDIKDKADEDVILQCVSGWELDDELNTKNVQLLCENYVGASGSIVETYLNELLAARTKN